MTRTTCHLSMSLDGCVAGPDQGPDDPVGVGGLRLHEWHWHADEPGHEQDLSWRDDMLAGRGAFVMGRNMFGPIRGEWGPDWRGWWGEDPPYHAPVFVPTPGSPRSRSRTHRLPPTSGTGWTGVDAGWRWPCPPRVKPQADAPGGAGYLALLV